MFLSSHVGGRSPAGPLPVLSLFCSVCWLSPGHRPPQSGLPQSLAVAMMHNSWFPGRLPSPRQWAPASSPHTQATLLLTACSTDPVPAASTCVPSCARLLPAVAMSASVCPARALRHALWAVLSSALWAKCTVLSRLTHPCWPSRGPKPGVGRHFHPPACPWRASAGPEQTLTVLKTVPPSRSQWPGYCWSCSGPCSLRSPLMLRWLRGLPVQRDGMPRRHCLWFDLCSP